MYDNCLETLKALKDSKLKFEKGIKKLNSEEKDHLLMYMYKARHNLLMNLAEEKNKNICLIIFVCAYLIIKIFMII